jgi:hypothetical protein
MNNIAPPLGPPIHYNPSFFSPRKYQSSGGLI